VAQAGRAYYCFCSAETRSEIVVLEGALARGEARPDRPPPRAATLVGHVCQGRRCTTLPQAAAQDRARKEPYVIRFKVRVVERYYMYVRLKGCTESRIYLPAQ
jgi:glutamyl/glutaminyl-tRNA synthetase